MGTVIQPVNQRIARNLASSIKDFGVNAGSAQNASAQQTNEVLKMVKEMPKGANLSILIENSSGATKKFVLFDAIGLAVENGAVNENDDLTITTTFAGGSSYAALVKLIAGTRLASVGAVFSWGSETYISSSNIKVWNGNLEDYNNKSAQNVIRLAKDTYANDPKTRIIASAFWINQYFALSGQLPDGGQLEILFNIPGQANY